jgi:hypothetical protein
MTTGPEIITGEVCVTAIAVTTLAGYFASRAAAQLRQAADKATEALREAIEKNWVKADVKVSVTPPDGRYLKPPPAAATPDASEDTAKPRLRQTEAA